MLEKKSSYLFNETLILNQIFEDMAQGSMVNISLSSVQTNRQMQENIYQAARQKMNHFLQQNKETISSDLNKKNHVSFWNKRYSYEDPSSTGSTEDSDKLGEGANSHSSQHSSYCTFGYDSSSSGE